MLHIRDLCANDVPAISAVNGGPAWHGEESKWSTYWAEHKKGWRVCILADDGDDIIGYASLVWRSQYGPFAEAGTPEIQDMVVAEGHRGRGIGFSLVRACEARAAAAGHREIGIGFGLYADYGAAQRLYVRLGYVPDGRGLTWNNEPARPGSQVRVDDDLVLWLSKSLAPASE